jgi:hypothetical protein
MAEDVGRLSAKRFNFSDRGMVEPGITAHPEK